ncbi:MAG: hypothetical protein HFI37_09205 [Lachnospiraceae bacterium]|nr:hypothetical protein [Lachnospiraceae bacterium]
MTKDMNHWNSAEEREINLERLFWKLLYGWRLILLSAVVGMLLLGGYSYFRSRQGVKQTQQNTEVSAKELEKGLTQEEKKKLRQAEVMVQELDDKETYREDSVLMNLDAYHQNRKVLQYYVDTGHTWSFDKENEEDYTNDLLKGYTSYVDDQGFLEGMKEQIKWEKEDEYLGELIASKDIDSIKGLEKQIQENTFSVYVTGENEKIIDEISEALEAAIIEYQAVLSEKIGEHELTLVDKHEGRFVNRVLAEQQDMLNAAILKLETDLDALITDFTDIQKRILMGDTEESESDLETKSTKATVSKKYLLLGFMAGIFLSALWIIMCYVLNKSIKSAEEVQGLYGLRIFGNLNIKVQGKNRSLSGIDYWLEKKQKKAIWSLEEERDLILTNLSVTCKKENIQKVFFTSALHLPDEDKKEIYFFIEGLEKAGVQAMFEENIIRNASAFEHMSEMENIVIVEKTEETQYETLEKQLTLCAEQNVVVLGMIMLV